MGFMQSMQQQPQVDAALSKLTSHERNSRGHCDQGEEGEHSTHPAANNTTKSGYQSAWNLVGSVNSRDVVTLQQPTAKTHSEAP